MNYYERHLGDYAKDAGHLSMLEHGAYSLLLDRYYATEHAIVSREDAYRVCRARSRDERAAVDAVLREFFVSDGESFINCRAEEEIAKARTRIEAARTNGRRGGRPKGNPDGNQTGTGQEPNKNPPGSQAGTQEKAHQSPDSTTASKKRGERGTRLPENWEPGSDGREFALSLGIGGLAFHDQASRFVDYWRAQPGQKGVKADWSATWRNWIRRAAGEKPLAQPGKSFRERDAEAKRAEVAAWTGGLLGKPRAEVIDIVEVANAPARLG